jgi:hypothetical protein
MLMLCELVTYKRDRFRQDHWSDPDNITPKNLTTIGSTPTNYFEQTL